MRDQHSCMSVFVAYLTIPSSNWGHHPRRDNSLPCMATWRINRDTEQPEEKET